MAVSNDVIVKIKADPSQILALTDVLIRHLSALRDDLERLQADVG